MKNIVIKPLNKSVSEIEHFAAINCFDLRDAWTEATKGIYYEGTLVGLVDFAYHRKRNNARYVYISSIEILRDYQNEGIASYVLWKLFATKVDGHKIQTISGVARPDAVYFWQNSGAKFIQGGKRLDDLVNDGETVPFDISAKAFALAYEQRRARIRLYKRLK